MEPKDYQESLNKLNCIYFILKREGCFSYHEKFSFSVENNLVQYFGRNKLSLSYVYDLTHNWLLIQFNPHLYSLIAKKTKHWEDDEWHGIWDIQIYNYIMKHCPKNVPIFDFSKTLGLTEKETLKIFFDNLNQEH